MERLHNITNNVRRGFNRDITEMVEYFNQARIYTTEIRLTDKCSFNCNYCYAESKCTKTKEISIERVKEIIDDCVELGIKQINWGGGEPLERKDWVDILSYSKDSGLTNLMMTNGMMLSDMGVAENFKELVSMSFVHIDTLDHEIWKFIHSSGDELHDLQINGLYNLLDLGYPQDDLAISMTLVKPILDNGDYIKTIDWAYDELGISAILYPYRSFGFAENTIELSPTNSQMAEAYKYRNSKDGLETGPGFGIKYYCGSKCYVTTEGHVLGCSMVYPTYAGNVNNRRFKDIYLDNRAMLTYEKLHLSENIEGVCNKCSSNTICWGCRAASELMAGGFEKGDPICWMNDCMESNPNIIQSTSSITSIPSDNIL